MSKEARHGRSQPEQSVSVDLAKVHGKDRKDLRRMARYAAMGQSGNLGAGQGFLPESIVGGTPAQHEGQPEI